MGTSIEDQRSRETARQPQSLRVWFGGRIDGQARIADCLGNPLVARVIGIATADFRIVINSPCRSILPSRNVPSKRRDVETLCGPKTRYMSRAPTMIFWRVKSDSSANSLKNLQEQRAPLSSPQKTGGQRMLIRFLRYDQAITWKSLLLRNQVHVASQKAALRLRGLDHRPT